MNSLSHIPFDPEITHDDFQQGVAGLQQVKAFSRWLGLSASLQSSSSEEAQFLKRWAGIESYHADLLSSYLGAHSNESLIPEDSPLKLAQNILQQESGSGLTPLFFQSLIGLKQGEIEQSSQLQQQAISHADKSLMTLLRKVQRDDRAVIDDVIAFCNQTKWQAADNRLVSSL